MLDKVAQFMEILPPSEDGVVQAMASVKAFLQAAPSDMGAIDLSKSKNETKLFQTEFLQFRHDLLVENVKSEGLKPVAKRGFLWKRSVKGPLKTWSRRFVWIQMPECLLMYLAKSAEDQPQVLADLSKCEFNPVEVDERQYTFELAESATQVVHLQAENEVEFAEWTTSIRAVRKGHVLSVERQITLPPREESPVAASFADLNITSDASMQDDRCHGPVQLWKREATSTDLSSSQFRSTFVRLTAKGVLVEFNQQEEHLADLAKDVKSRCHIQTVDESLFGKKTIISITTLAGVTYYIRTSGLVARDAWLHALKNAAPEDHLSGMVDQVGHRTSRKFEIRILEARKLLPSLCPYCVIYLGSDMVAKTNPRPQANGEPFWREEFRFDDLPPLRQGITIAVMNQCQLKRDDEIGRVVISTPTYTPMETEAWFPIVQGMTSNENLVSVGELKLALYYDEDRILDLRSYQDLSRLFRQPNTPLVYDLAQVTPELEYISNLMLRIFDAQGLALDWIKVMLEREIDQTDTKSVLFRGNSVLTKAFDGYMKVCGMEYLDQTIGNIIRQIYDNKVYCEVDATRLDKDEDVQVHWRRLQSYAVALWKSIDASRTKVPHEFRILFHHLQRVVLRKFNDAREDNYVSVRYTAVSGFFFLRLICPAVLNPKLFGLVRDLPDAKTSRTFTLLAKTLQCLANLANFGVKEPYMVGMNVFIMDHSNQLMEFIDSISVRSLAEM